MRPEVSTAGAARKALARYRSGSGVHVYYNPQKLSAALLERGLSASNVVLPMAGTAFLVVGVVLVAFR
jgi:hypothetical protein